MHTLKVTLKQHTPLIHFQHDQEGATLRASEVKPKLDKFILTKLGNGDYQQGINTAKENKWLVGKGEHPALDYKMRIDINSNSTRTEYLLASYIKGSDAKNLENREIKVISNSPFFAQEKQNSQIVKSHNVIADWNKIEKKGIVESDDTNVLILTKKEDLFSEILKYIQLFFISTNFGTRQSKGFGCFLPTKIEYNQKNKELKNNEELLKQEFSFVYKKTLQSSEIVQILQTINDDYKLLKSGINIPKTRHSNEIYKKSILFEYFVGKGFRWEKRKIKQGIRGKGFNLKGKKPPIYGNNEKTEKGWNDPQTFQYYFIRALLGLSSKYEFKLYNEKDKDVIIVSVFLKGDEIVEEAERMHRNDYATIVDENDKTHYYELSSDIERFRSPLLFKVIDNNVYLVGNELSKEIQDKEFIFRIHDYRNKRNDMCSLEESKQKDFILSTPKDFSLVDFMKMASTKIGYTSLSNLNKK